MDVQPPTLGPRPDASRWRTDAVPPLWSRWHPGPARAPAGEPVLVSFTEYTYHRPRDLPGVTRAGVRLSRGWFAMEGAIGLLLYTQPLAMRSGSLTAWRSEADLRRFFNLPLHLETVRRFRSRGTLRAVKWRVETFDLPRARAEARRLLAA